MNGPSFFTLETQFDEPSRPSSPSSHFPTATPQRTSSRLASLIAHPVVRLLKAVLGKVLFRSLEHQQHPPAGIRRIKLAGGAELAGLGHISTHSLTHSLYQSLTALPLHRPRESSCLTCDDVPKEPTQALTNPIRPCLLLAPSHPDPDRRDSAGLDSTRSTVALDSIEPVSGYHCRRRPRGSPPWRSSRRAPTSTT